MNPVLRAVTTAATATAAAAVLLTAGGAVLPAVAADAPFSTQAPSVTGTVADGTRLDCDPGTWSPSAGTTYDFYWTLDSVVVDASVGYDFYLVDNGRDQPGGKITCWVRGTNGGVSSGYRPANPVTVPGASSGGTSGGSAGGSEPAPTLSASGSVLTCAAPAGSPVSYRWTRDGSPITTADATDDDATYTLTGDDAGRLVRCLTAVGSGGYQQSDPYAVPGTPSSSGSSGSSGPGSSGGPDTTPFSQSAPTVLGTVADGARLDCDPGTWSPSAGTTYDYYWTLNSVPVPASVGYDFYVVDYARDHTGDQITCWVRATNGGRPSGYRPANPVTVGATGVPRPAAPRVTVSRQGHGYAIRVVKAGGYRVQLARTTRSAVTTVRYGSVVRTRSLSGYRFARVVLRSGEATAWRPVR